MNVLASDIGTLTNPSKLENAFRSALHSKISSNTISSYIGYLEDAFVIEEARRYDVKGRGLHRQLPEILLRRRGASKRTARLSAG